MLLLLRFAFSLPLFFSLQSATTASSQQPYRTQTTGSMSNDLGYRPLLRKPAFAKNGPVMLLDEGHQNLVFNEGFARLSTADGYKVRRSPSKFTADLLKKANILVILEPGIRGAVASPMAPPPPFTDEEAAVVHDWIMDGGALLFALNGFAAGPHSVLTKLGVEFNLGFVTDPQLRKASDNTLGSMGYVFSGEQFLSSSHKIILGRSPAEQVRSVVVAGMNGIKTKPEGAASLLQCSEDAQFNPDPRQIRVVAKSDAVTSNAWATVPAPHTPIAIAYTLGKGRIVVLGDARMVSATIYYDAANLRDGHYAGLRQGDNQQFTLNVMHWLSRLLE
jgi:hypothetical protein